MTVLVSEDMDHGGGMVTWGGNIFETRFLFLSLTISKKLFSFKSSESVISTGGGANTKVPDMYGVGWVFSGPKTQK